MNKNTIALLLGTVAIVSALCAGCATAPVYETSLKAVTIPASAATLTTSMSARAASDFLARQLQDCSGQISGQWGEKVHVVKDGPRYILSVHSEVFETVWSLGTTEFANHAMKDLYIIEPSAKGGSLVHVKSVSYGFFHMIARSPYDAAKRWLDGDTNCSGDDLVDDSGDAIGLQAPARAAPARMGPPGAIGRRVMVDRDLGATFGPDGRGGLLVTSVAVKGPAAKAGIHVGDVVTAVDGQPTAAYSYWGSAAALIPDGEGETVELTVVER